MERKNTLPTLKTINIILYVLMVSIICSMYFAFYGWGLSSFQIILIIEPLLSFLIKPCQKGKRKQILINKIFLVFSVLYIVAVLFYSIFNGKSYYFPLYVILFLCIGLILDEALKSTKRIEQINKSINFCFVICAIIISCLFYTVFINPCTVKRASELISENGYSNIRFINYANDGISISVLTSSQITHPERAGYYMFEAEKNGDNHFVLFDIKNNMVSYSSLIQNIHFE